MRSMLTQILLYEEMNMLSARMAEAARASDWETLAKLERSVAALRDALPDNDEALSATELQQKTLLIQRILDDDAEIRRHTEPWMEHLCRFLSCGAKGSKTTPAQTHAL